MRQQTHDLQYFKVIMIGEHQQKKQGQKEIGPTRIAQIGKLIRENNRQPYEYQPIKHYVSAKKQKQNAKHSE